MEIYRLAKLSDPPDSIAVGSGDLREERLEWIQPIDRWGVIFYHHSNVVGVDAHSFIVEPGDAVFFPPGSRGSHIRVDNDTHHWVLIYRLPGTTNDLTAIPLHYKGIQRFQQDLERAAARLFIDPRALKAFAWNLMWSVGRDSAFARAREELYAAEDYILKNLSGHLVVAEIADASGKSPRQLLRAFREEHGMTIQEYIRHRRVREATRLLSTTRTPVKEVASRVGVSDLHAFNKLIREETGLSPRRFREKSMEDRLS